ncbi:MAG: response regulator [Acidobacteria bacterium]|nr:response regulator [Acidobacteriota bacterium]
MSSRLRRSKLLLHFRGGAVSQNGYEDTEPAAGSIIGPVPMLARGLALETTEHLDGALLDINLAGERCFPIAEALKVRDVPFAFLTGYVDFGTPPEYRGAPLLTKPFSIASLLELMACNFKVSASAPRHVDE